VHGLPKTRNDEKHGFVMTRIFPNRIVDEFLVFSMNFLAGRLKHESPQPEASPSMRTPLWVPFLLRGESQRARAAK
jgi:hypothetical protein